MPRYETKSDFTSELFDKLGSGTKNALSLVLQQKLQDKQRKQALQDTVKKALLESQLKGKRLRPDADMSKVVTGEGTIDMAQLEDYNPLASILGGNENPQNAQGTGQVLGGGMRLKGVTTDEEGNLKYNLEPVETQEDINRQLDKEKQKEIIKGVSGEVGGRVALAKESMKNIEDVINSLFSKNQEGAIDPKTFNREIAFGANPPAVRLPFMGRVGSPVRRDNPLDPTDNAKAQAAQDVFRKLGASLSGRQLIQTGVAARPEETEKLVAQFAPNFFSNPEAALKGLQELQAFYNTYLQQTDPSVRFSGQPIQADNQPQAENNNYKVGQNINVGGKQYQITGFDTDGEPLVDEVM